MRGTRRDDDRLDEPEPDPQPEPEPDPDADIAPEATPEASEADRAPVEEAGLARKDPSFLAAIRGVALAAVAVTAFAFIGFGFHVGIGAMIGGALATANLLVFARIVEAFLSNRERSTPWTLLAFVKLTALLAVVWLIVRSGEVSVLGLVFGYGALPIGITLGTLMGRRDDPSGRP